MTTIEAFLSDILAHPADETLRLVFADWLEDNGDCTDAVGAAHRQRAEFIRVECQREKIPSFYPEWDKLDRRARELLDANEERWFGPLQALVTEFETSRGFAESITLKASQFIKKGKAILALAPVRKLSLLQAKAQARPLAGCPHLTRIERLQFDSQQSVPLDATACRALTASSCLTNLLELDLTGCRVGVSGFKALMCSKSFPRLEVLDLDGNSVGNGVYAYLRRARFPALKKLNLGTNYVNDACLGGLAWAESFDALEDLYLYHNHLTVIGAGELSRWPHLKKLQLLNLHSNPFGDEGVAVLARAPLTALRELHLGRVGVGVVGVSALAAASLPHLSDLTLHDNPLRPEGVSALTHASWLGGLTNLDLTDCSIGSEGLIALLKAKHLPKPRELFLNNNEIDDDGLVELARSPLLAETTRLSLINNPLTSRSAQALYSSPYLAHIRSLFLPKQIGDAGQQEKLSERFAQANVFFV